MKLSELIFPQIEFKLDGKRDVATFSHYEIIGEKHLNNSDCYLVEWLAIYHCEGLYYAIGFDNLEEAYSGYDEAVRPYNDDVTLTKSFYKYKYSKPQVYFGYVSYETETKFFNRPVLTISTRQLSEVIDEQLKLLAYDCPDSYNRQANMKQLPEDNLICMVNMLKVYL